LRSKVEELMKVIRPAMQADGGDIVLHDVDEATGIVIVELAGACVGCSMAEVDLKLGVERVLKDHIPGVNEVVALS
jgi:Fe-S cluster biogenesis protein NfuA